MKRTELNLIICSRKKIIYFFTECFYLLLFGVDRGLKKKKIT